MYAVNAATMKKAVVFGQRRSDTQKRHAVSCYRAIQQVRDFDHTDHDGRLCSCLRHARHTPSQGYMLFGDHDTEEPTSVKVDAWLNPK